MELNSPDEMYARYGHCSGKKYLEARSHFHQEGRVLMSASGIMKRISEVAPESFSNCKVRQDWLSACLYTCDAVAVHPKGRAKLVLGAEWDTAVLKHGVLSMTNQAWEDLMGSEVMELSQERVKELQRPYSIEDAKRVKELQFLAGGSQNLDFYLDAISSMNNHTLIKLLRPFTPHPGKPSLRPLELNSAYNISQNGDVIVLGELDTKGCVVIGEAKRNGNSKQPTLAQILALGKGKMSGEHWDQYVRDAERLCSEH